MLTLLQAAPGAGGGTSMFVMLGLMLVVMVVFIILPQRRQQKAIQKFRDSLAVGSEVVLASGVHGVVKSLNEGESFLTVEISKGVAIKVERTSVYERIDQMQQR